MRKIKYPIHCHVASTLSDFEKFKKIFLSSTIGDTLVFAFKSKGFYILESKNSTGSFQSQNDLNYESFIHTFKYCIHFDNIKDADFELSITSGHIHSEDVSIPLGEDAPYTLVNHLDPPSELKALILVGGKSTRMGRDKASLHYHGQPQYQYLIKLCKNAGLDTYLSARNATFNQYDYAQIIYDELSLNSPLNGILTAQARLKTAILVIACDLPYLRQDDITYLIQQRNPHLYATAYHNHLTQFPDPLFTILEPITEYVYQRYVSLGYQCPRKMLINFPIKEINVLRDDVLYNVNTEDKRQHVLKDLK